MKPRNGKYRARVRNEKSSLQDLVASRINYKSGGNSVLGSAAGT